MPKRKRLTKTKRLDEIDDLCFSIPRIPGSRRRGRGSPIMSTGSKKWNTNTFESHFEIVRKNFSEGQNSSFAFLDSLWFSLYLTESSREKVLDWIKRKRIFSKKYVIIPIVCWGHWRLLIFCHFGEVSKSKKRTPCMLLLDSLQMANPKRIEPDIRRFVMDIYKVEERPESGRTISQIPLLVPEVPQQRNGEDCGLFVLYFTTLFVENAPVNFSTSEGYPYFMKKDWFSLEDLEEFYDKLASQS